MLSENQKPYELTNTESVSFTGITSISDNETLTIVKYITITEIVVDGRHIHFNKPMVFEVKDDDLIPGNFYVEDDLIYIHESSPDLKELNGKVREALEIQWEDIAMEDDSKLNEDAKKLKKYLLSFT